MTKPIVAELSWPLTDLHRGQGGLGGLMCTSPAETEQAAPCRLASHALDECSLCGLNSAPFFGPF